MTGQEYYSLFSEAMKKRRIIRYENETSRDDYHTYAIRETPFGYVFFCLLETFFRTGKGLDSWIKGSLVSYHELQNVQGADINSLIITNEIYVPRFNYNQMLPVLKEGEPVWITVS